MVHAVNGIQAPGAAHGGHGRTRLAPEQAGIGRADHSGTFQKSLHGRGDIRRIHGRTEHDAVGLTHLGKAIVETVVNGYAACLPLAGETAQTAAQGKVGQGNDFAVDARPARFIADNFQQYPCIAVLAGAAVERRQAHAYPRGDWSITVKMLGLVKWSETRSASFALAGFARRQAEISSVICSTSRR